MISHDPIFENPSHGRFVVSPDIPSKVSADSSQVKTPSWCKGTAGEMLGACNIFQDIPEELRQLEPALMTLKWFDYRFMAPEAATQAFLDCYKFVLARGGKETVLDYETARFVVEGPWCLDSSTLVGLWRARQLADALCMPYPVFAWCTMAFAAVCYGNPEKLYLHPLTYLNSIRAVEFAKEIWESGFNDVSGICASKALAQLPQYKRWNHASEIAQDDYDSWLLDRLNAFCSPCRVRALASIHYTNGQLNEGYVARSASAQEQALAKSLAESQADNDSSAEQCSCNRVDALTAEIASSFEFSPDALLNESFDHIAFVKQRYLESESNRG